MIQSYIPSKNPFIQQAERVRAGANVQRSNPASAPSASRARLNFLPDAPTLLSMIDRALGALSMGRIWDRGSIVNLLV